MHGSRRVPNGIGFECLACFNYHTGFKFYPPVIHLHDVVRARAGDDQSMHAKRHLGQHFDALMSLINCFGLAVGLLYTSRLSACFRAAVGATSFGLYVWWLTHLCLLA